MRKTKGGGGGFEGGGEVIENLKGGGGYWKPKGGGRFSKPKGGGRFLLYVFTKWTYMLKKKKTYLNVHMMNA